MINNEEDALSSTNQDDDSQQNQIKEWRSKFEAGTLTTNDIIKFFQNSAPNFFELHQYSDIVRCRFNENGAKFAIIDVLEEFILGDHPQTILEKIKLEGNAPAVCGRVFKIGEPTYSCRECGMDYTCVLCVNCFKQSAHRYHKYRMSTSNGGGCCDCGDEEAWKKDPYCEEHIRGKEIQPESSVITSRMKERCEIAFRAIIMYSIKFLSIEAYGSMEGVEDYNFDDVFCTFLFNDESHTFEQVIQTIIKIVKVSQKDAMEIVTSIDREGRAVLTCDTFEACILLKKQFEVQQMRHSANINRQSPLLVSVLHKSAVSGQQFSIQLLTWFQEFLTRHMTFRQIFATVINDKSNPNYNIGRILEYDYRLWKTARSCWHRLLISGMLMEYNNKKILALEFSKHYATIIQDFIRDDHDHSISIVSLSVQLFTVPTLAHYLIANEDIFHKLLHVFYSEAISKYVQNGIVHFAKNAANLNAFKRAAYITFDLRYLLSFKPDVWTLELREGFIEGVKVLLKLLNVMQGMDSAFRQTGQHMDYEPEWESAFNLHIKLAPIITLVLDWSATDVDVLVKIYKMVMTYLMDNEFVVGRRPSSSSSSSSDERVLNLTVMEEKTYAGHVANCLMYDVSRQYVSIHLALSRFFAGIYLNLGKYDLNFDNIITARKRTPEEIIEPVLCTQTMVAQVHAGMWRRNGYSLLHQLYFYKNQKCRAEMLDRDIACLQIGAALIESNQFLIHILNKFDLLTWADPNYVENNKTASDDDHIRLLNMIDEFLELLIIIIGERYVPGIGCVTEEDRTKKEIIQLLCIKNFSHSEFSRALPEQVNGSILLEDVIESIATFNKPSKSDAKGVYELKEEFYDDYNMYFYHYTKEDKSKSEETQRLRRKKKGLLVCCPPPKLPKLTNSFISIANLLQCDVMLTLMEVILNRALNLRAKTFQDSYLQKVLHLIGYGLQEEESGNYPFLTFRDRAIKYNILQLLEKLIHSVRVEIHRDLIIWTVKKFKELQSTKDHENVESMETDDENQPMTAAEAERQEKEERAKLAAEHRAKIMAQMANAQNNFLKSNAELFASTSTATKSNEMDWENYVLDNEEENDTESLKTNSIACLGPNRRIQQPEEQKFKCILCFEECEVNKDGNILVYSAFIQKSRVLYEPDDDHSPAPYISTCGHVMHSSCWKVYYDNELIKENRRPNRQRPPSNFLIDKKEFLCPYCRCLSNAIIPLTLPLMQFAPPIIFKSENDAIPFDLWVTIMSRYLDELFAIERTKVLCDECDDNKTRFPNVDEIVREFVNPAEFKKLCPFGNKEVTESWKDYAESFMSSAQTISPYPHTSEDCEPVLIVWNSCAYTIQSLEMYLRAINKPFKNSLSIRQTSCLTGLIRFSGMLGESSINKGIAEKLLIHLRGILETVFKQQGPSVLEWDIFPILLSLIFHVTSTIYAYDNMYMIPSGNYLEYYFLKLMFMANIVKAIVLYRTDETPYMEVDSLDDEDARIFALSSGDSKVKQSEQQTTEGTDGSDSTGPGDTGSSNKIEKRLANIANFYKRYNLQLREEGSSAEISPRTIRRLIKHIKNESRTFLRCSCLLFRFLTDVEFPDEFSTPDGDTFDIMCKYLGLNSEIEYYFDSDGPYLFSIELFGSHPDILNYDSVNLLKPDGERFVIIPCVLPIRQLVTLPDDYSDLINDVSDYTCPNNDKEESRNPTMCLICGDVLCGQSYCCQPFLDKTNVGACTYHVHHCGADIGLFLRIRECQILYLGINKGCTVSPPYLDEYGETDPGLRRGNPLRLCHERYRKLHLTWLGHSLHEEIAHFNESASSVIATVWQHM